MGISSVACCEVGSRSCMRLLTAAIGVLFILAAAWLPRLAPKGAMCGILGA